MGIGKVSGWTAWVAGSAALAARHSLGVPMAGGSAGRASHEADRAAMMSAFFGDVWEGDAALPQPGVNIPRRFHARGGRQLTEALSDRVVDTRPETLSGLPATLAICQADPSGRTPLPSRETFARAAMELLEVATQPNGDAAVTAQLARTQVRPLAAALGAFVAQNQGGDAASLVGPDGDYTGPYLARAASAYPFGGPIDLQTKLAGADSGVPRLGVTTSSGPSPQQSGVDVCQVVGDSSSAGQGTSGQDTSGHSTGGQGAGADLPPLPPVPLNQQAPRSAPGAMAAPSLPTGGAGLPGGMQSVDAVQGGPPAGTGAGAGAVMGAGAGAGTGLAAASRAIAPLSAGPAASQSSQGPL